MPTFPVNPKQNLVELESIESFLGNCEDSEEDSVSLESNEGTISVCDSMASVAV